MELKEFTWWCERNGNMDQRGDNPEDTIFACEFDDGSSVEFHDTKSSFGVIAKSDGFRYRTPNPSELRIEDESMIVETDHGRIEFGKNE